jgi:hypothetical protein
MSGDNQRRIAGYYPKQHVFQAMPAFQQNIGPLITKATYIIDALFGFRSSLAAHFFNKHLPSILCALRDLRENLFSLSSLPHLFKRILHIKLNPFLLLIGFPDNSRAIFHIFNQFIELCEDLFTRFCPDNRKNSKTESSRSPCGDSSTSRNQTMTSPVTMVSSGSGSPALRQRSLSENSSTID